MSQTTMSLESEEHFLADGFREAMKRNAPSQGEGSNAAYNDVCKGASQGGPEDRS